MPDFPWLNDLIDWVTQIFSQDTETLLRTYGPAYGYYIILFLTFLEGETIVIIAGFLASQGVLNPYLIALYAFCGSFTSDQLMFSLGKYKGRSILNRFPRIGKNVGKASRMLYKYDTYLILGFRFVYGVRNVTPILLGVSGVSHLKFFCLNFIGASVWAIAFTAGGYFFGKIFENAMAQIGSSVPYIIAAIVVLGGLYWWKRKKTQKNAASPDSSEETADTEEMADAEKAADSEEAADSPASLPPQTEQSAQPAMPDLPQAEPLTNTTKKEHH